jgi:two-component system response regulator FixJ
LIHVIVDDFPSSYVCSKKGRGIYRGLLADVASQIVAIVEDDAAIRDSLGFLMRARGVEARCYASAAEFLGSDDVDQLGSLLIDQNMPNMTGIELIELLRSRKILIPAIMLTGGTDPLLAGRAKKAGVLTVLNKPFPSDELMGWIRLALISGGAKSNGHAAIGRP